MFTALSSLWQRLGGSASAAAAKLPSKRERLFAAWLGLAVVMLLTRWRVLELAERQLHPAPVLVAYLPLAFYQDVLLLAVLSWVSWAILAAENRPGARRVFYVAAWMICLVAAGYSALSAEIYRYLRSPLTYRLLVLGENLNNISDSVLKAMTSWRLAKIFGAPLLVIVIARALCRFAPGALGRVTRAFHTPVAVACLLLYLMAGELWAVRVAAYPPAISNPEWRLCESMFERGEPFISGTYPRQYLDDFIPIGERRRAGIAAASMPATPALAAGSPRLRNVLMVVLESVGAHYVGIDGAPYQDTPELSKLASHAALFKRLYVSNPFSANAMAGIVCSVYPYHGWRSLPLHAPDLGIPGIASVLGAHGYRTGVIYAGHLWGRMDKEFLHNHGFTEIDDASVLLGGESDHGPAAMISEFRDRPRDGILAPAALNWIEADRSRPFFLMLWTNDTHYPYAPASHENFGVRDQDLNRYLNAIKGEDAMIGEIARELSARGLADSTLVVVTGDHGEQFGARGHIAHGWSAYEEEITVPLMVENPRLFAHERQFSQIGRQIDIPPTILGLLGIQSPGNWQGHDLFAPSPPRAYCFASMGDYIFALVEGDFKFMYDSNLDRELAFDLGRDPGEQTNLIGNPAYAKRAGEAHQRLAAWYAYQNAYLANLIRGPARGLAAGNHASTAN